MGLSWFGKQEPVTASGAHRLSEAHRRRSGGIWEIRSYQGSGAGDGRSIESLGGFTNTSPQRVRSEALTVCWGRNGGANVYPIRVPYRVVFLCQLSREINHLAGLKVSGGGRGIRTLDTLLTYTHFPGVRLQPLGHPSVEARVIARGSRLCKPPFHANDVFLAAR